MQPELPECQCLACAQLQHHQANDTMLLFAIGTVLLVGGLVWLVGQVAGLLASGVWPDVSLTEVPGILARLREHPERSGDGVAGQRARSATRPGGHVRHPGRHPAHPAGAGGAGLVAAPATRPPEATSHTRRPTPAGTAATGRPPGPAHAAPARAQRGGAMIAATLRAEPTGLTGLWRSGGDAQERAATNPVAALPCARTPLPTPLSIPLLIPLLRPSSATVGVTAPDLLRFGLVKVSDPGRSRAKTARDRPGSPGKLTAWRATRSGWVAGAVVAGRPPTNGVGGLPAGSLGHPGHGGWSDG
jgi:hypothetical protein